MSFELSSEAQASLNKVLARFDASEKRHTNYRSRWDHYYRLYRSHLHFREWYQSANGQERDTAVVDMKRDWGAELFIPYSFEVVEQILPRAVANRPEMHIGPRADTPEQNVANMKMLIAGQQTQIGYELVLQDVAKSGFIYGLGIEKTGWRYDARKQKMLKRGIMRKWVEGERERVLFDDPDAENVDIFDFFWDPFAKSLRRPYCKYAIHRTWRDTTYVLDKLKSGQWNNPGGVPVDEVQHMSAGGKYDEAHQTRLEAAGQDSAKATDTSQLHEVWEYHDGDEVIVILDRLVPVHACPNPAWHCELPFHAYRPNTPAIDELPGIGEIEPIEHLQQEMNTLRSQRRDNATFVLQRAYAYADGFVDPENLKVGPGVGIPVNGDPRELLFPLPVQDIPASGYQEESNLKADIERVTGLSDPTTGVGDAGATATGVQLVQSAAGVRIQNKTRRLEVEIIAPTAVQWVSLNQQHIVQERTMSVPEPGMTGEKWKQVNLGPAELHGDMYVIAEGGSTAPENVPQMRQDGQMLWQMFSNNPTVDQRELTRTVLRNMGIRNPDMWLTPDQRVPPVFLDLLASKGMDPEMIAALLAESQQLEEQQRSQPPGAAPVLPEASEAEPAPEGAPAGVQEPQAVA